MRAVTREAIFLLEDDPNDQNIDPDNPPFANGIHCDKVTFDTGANSANYIAWDLLLALGIHEDDPRLSREQLPHVVTLGDGNHQVHIDESVRLKLALKIPAFAQMSIVEERRKKDGATLTTGGLPLTGDEEIALAAAKAELGASATITLQQHDDDAAPGA